jgi:hypothetical protein
VIRTHVEPKEIFVITYKKNVISRTPIFGGILWHVQGKNPRDNRPCHFEKTTALFGGTPWHVQDKQTTVNLKKKGN